MRAVLTPDDLKKGEKSEVGWAPLEIIAYDEATVKGTAEKPSDGSLNCIFTFKCIDGANKGREYKRYYNEKALGFGKNLWNFLFNFDKIKGGELTSEMFRSSVGKKMLGYIALDKKTGYDTIEDYRPMTAQQ